MTRRLLFGIFVCTLLLVTSFVAFVTFGPSSLLLDIHPQAIDVPFPKSFTGSLTPNEILSSAQKLFVNQLHGPESLAIYNSSIFTGTDDGYIYRVDGNNLKPLIKLINNECPHVWNRTSCGRPLGMKFDSKGVLYVVEPSHGIYTVENMFTNTPIVTLVFHINHTSVLGKPSVFLDDVAIDENGGENVLYISDMSNKHTLYQFMHALSDSSTGRLISYNTATNKVKTVITGLLCPNGVELTDDRSAVLVSETGMRRILKHYIRGPKAGETIALISELPGEPDNIRRSATYRETYWITLTMARTESNQHSSDTLNRHPLLKKFIVRFIYIVGSVIDIIGNLFGSYSIRELGFGIKSGNLLVLNAVNNTYCMAIEFDVNGIILESLHSPDGSVSALSEAREVRISDTESMLYLGSYFNHYLGKLWLNNRV